MKKLEFEVIPLEKQKPTEIRDSYLELYENHLLYRVNFTAEEWINSDDEALGTEERINDFEILAMKENVSGIEIFLTENQTQWRIDILVIGFPHDIKLFFKTKKKAFEFYEQLKYWRLNNETSQPQTP